MAIMRIGIEDNRVILETGEVGQSSHYVRLNWEQALQLAGALLQKGRELEAALKVHETIADGAVLFRAGVPIGLTNDPAVQKEIVKEAINNRTLRRSNLRGVKSKAIVGVPTVRQLAPDASIAERVSAMNDLERAHLRQALKGRN